MIFSFLILGLMSGCKNKKLESQISSSADELEGGKNTGVTPGDGSANPVAPVPADRPTIVINTSTVLTKLNSLTLNFTIQGLIKDRVRSIGCSLNSMSSVDCSGLVLQMTNLIDGNHLARIVLITTANIRIEKEFSFTKDAAAPNINVSSTPGSLTSSKSVNFAFTVTDSISGVSRISCKIDSEAPVDCSIGFSKSNLSEGDHIFTIDAIDMAGNSAPQYQYRWTVDASVPTVTITQSGLPALNTQAESATFSFSGASTYECKLAAETSFSACTSPKSYTALSQGQQSFKVRGRSGTGVLSSEQEYRWIIDRTPPEISVTGKPAAVITQINTEFLFTATDSLSGIESSQCVLDSSSPFPCQTRHDIANLTIGAHTFRINATDKAGNKAVEYIHNWTVEEAIQPLVASESFYAEQPNPDAGYKYSVRLYEANKVNFFVGKAAFSPLAGARSFLGMKENAKLNLGKVAIGERSTSVIIKIVNDTNDAITLNRPNLENSKIPVDFGSTAFPLTIQAQKEIDVQIRVSGSEAGALSSSMNWTYGSLSKKQKLLLTAK